MGLRLHSHDDQEADRRVRVVRSPRGRPWTENPWELRGDQHTFVIPSVRYVEAYTFRSKHTTLFVTPFVHPPSRRRTRARCPWLSRTAKSVNTAQRFWFPSDFLSDSTLKFPKFSSRGAAPHPAGLPPWTHKRAKGALPP